MEFLQRLNNILSPTVIRRSDDLAGHGLADLRHISDVLSFEMPDAVFNPERAMGDFYMFKQLARQHQQLSMLAFGKIMCQSFSDTYPDFVLLFQIYMVVPLNSASCERGFSKQNIIKTKLRNRTSEDRMDQLTRISINGPDFSLFDYYDDPAQHFQ